jgi:hypothetical protein
MSSAATKVSAVFVCKCHHALHRASAPSNDQYVDYMLQARSATVVTTAPALHAPKGRQLREQHLSIPDEIHLMDDQKQPAAHI